MKAKNWVITALAFFIVSLANATDTPKMNVVSLGTQKALVSFKSPTAATLEITITNNSGEIVYYKKSEAKLNEYRKIFDFSELGNGNFNVCLDYGLYSINRDLQVSKKTIIVGPAEKLFEPYFFIKNGRINMSFLNVAQKNVHMEVYKNGEYISSTSLGKDMSLQKSIDLSKSGKGNYEIVISDLFKNHRFFVQL